MQWQQTLRNNHSDKITKVSISKTAQRLKRSCAVFSTFFTIQGGIFHEFRTLKSWQLSRRHFLSRSQLFQAVQRVQVLHRPQAVFLRRQKSDIDASIAAEDIDVGYDEESSVGITFADGSAAIDGEGATSEGETVTISQAGTYILSGTATNGRIIVSADKTAEIKLILNGVDITCADNAPLLVSKAKKVYIVLEDGTENVFDGQCKLLFRRR